jgi:hypothetical protein
MAFVRPDETYRKTSASQGRAVIACAMTATGSTHKESSYAIKAASFGLPLKPDEAVPHKLHFPTRPYRLTILERSNSYTTTVPAGQNPKPP